MQAFFVMFLIHLIDKKIKIKESKKNNTFILGIKNKKSSFAPQNFIY